jgi:hypothetical protein
MVPRPPQPRSCFKTQIEDLPGTANATPPPEGPVTNDQVNHIIERLQGIILNNGGGLRPNGGAARRLRPMQSGVLLTTFRRLRDTSFQRYWRWICTTEEGRTGIDTAGCTHLRHPEATDMAPMVVDTLGALRRRHGNGSRRRWGRGPAVFYPRGPAPITELFCTLCPVRRWIPPPL